ncbi:MAG: putative ATP-grasp superfamily ATP-dependent carboligase [Candidatus Paceibacteria bacterium]|jgi:predicted ATP-grasp superfamily ATP-dependent carboligase
MNKSSKNIILYVAQKPTSAMTHIKAGLKKALGYKVQVAVLFDKKNITKIEKPIIPSFDILIPCDFRKPESIIEALSPYKDRLLAISTRAEKNIPYLQAAIPHVAYLRTPTIKSLEWSVDKIKMRKHFRAYDRKITPKFKIVKDTKKDSIKKIEDDIGYPVVIKPSGLAGSLLVTMAYHKEELVKNLRTIFRKINKAHKDQSGRGIPQVLVEQFMEGDMYSVDTYITSRGKIYFCPFVKVITGKNIGFDDFFGYKRILPTKLSKENIKKAETVATKSIHALGLRSTTAHIELMKTESGWKIIEVGPRIGGYRESMYREAYDIPHSVNDILIRIPAKPIIPKKIKAYTIVYNFYAKKEGWIASMKGVKKAENLASVKVFKQNKKIGDRSLFAKHGGKPVLEVTLVNKNRTELLADSRRIEKLIDIKTK